MQHHATKNPDMVPTAAKKNCLSYRRCAYGSHSINPASSDATSKNHSTPTLARSQIFVSKRNGQSDFL